MKEEMIEVLSAEDPCLAIMSSQLSSASKTGQVSVRTPGVSGNTNPSDFDHAQNIRKPMLHCLICNQVGFESQKPDRFLFAHLA
jgi:hypothetical protein